ncbi:MAG: FHA domain-containing protein [Oscillospiraceae bacterium]|nr:FHA domain-containing protein [Oscillospiraceae bacterium]
MVYEIKHKSDFQAGATLIVRIPEGESDKKALYTIIKEQPSFLLPFYHREIDGEIEFTYQIAGCTKFAYLPASRSAGEYINLLLGILQPLLECGDWFMSPYSFLLTTDYLYFDKSGKTKFVYIPSARHSSEYIDLKNMIAEIAKQSRITDINLENKVLWAIQDFKPDEFARILKSYKPETSETPEKPDKPETVLPPTQKKPDDIDINFISEKSPKPEKPAKKGLFDFMKNKKQKQKNEPDQRNPEPGVLEADGDLTQLIENSEPKLTGFRYCGVGAHPEIIEIDIAEGCIFTIGRFDMSAGVKQSDFEFEAKTKAVSRRHAAVEKNAEGYFLVDLSSSAGTFLDGQKMPQNAPFKLESGSRVSFGFSGADYTWEQ